MVEGTYVAARSAVDTALTAVDLALEGEESVYALCRPPGHHAANGMFGGYCFLNNAAIAAEELVRRTGEVVAIRGVDYHHGSGSQQIFYARGDVLYVSLHGDPTACTRTSPGSPTRPAPLMFGIRETGRSSRSSRVTQGGGIGGVQRGWERR